MAEQSQQRNEVVDALAGMFMFLIMLQHFNILTMAPYTTGHLFMFNTIWFFWKAGMFHRPRQFTKKTIWGFTKRFMIPFVMLIPFAMILCLVGELVNGNNLNVFGVIYSFAAQILHIGAPWWDIPLWFLLTFFFVKIITCNYRGRNTWVYVLLCMTVGMLHYHLIGEDFNYIGNTAIATLFYVSGYTLRGIRLNRWWYMALALLFVAIFFMAPCAYDIFWNKPRYGNYYLSIVVCIIGIVLFNKLFDYLRFLHIRPLVYIGQNAMVFLIFHVPFAMLVRSLPGGVISATMGPWVEAAISLPLCYLVCLLFERNKNIQWIIGK